MGPQARGADANRAVPGKRTRVQSVGDGPIQRKADGEQTGGSPTESFALATSGAATAVPYRAQMERSFGTSFGDVGAHLGGAEAQAGLTGLGARAAAHGNQVAFRDAAPSQALVAHELAHVVQQRNGGGVQCKPVDVSQPGDAAEARADAAADAVMRGEPVPDVGTATGGAIHRAVDTNGGTWDANPYTATNSGAGVGKVIGASIQLEFMPNDLVEADNIGLTQTVNTQKSAAAGGATNTPSAVSARNTALSLPAAGVDPGRAIDQGDPSPGGDTIPNTNPLYPVENSPGSVSATLTDVAPTAGFGSHGHRKRKPDGTFDRAPATLGDGPGRQIEFAGQTWDAKFETTALVLDGPMANTYLGSVEWGYQVDATGVCTTKPLRRVRAGAPTSEFMAAAGVWNSATFTNPDPADATVYNTVDLPTTTVDSLGVDAKSMPTIDLINRIATVDGELAKLAAGTDRTNKQFEKRALEAELGKRNAKISVLVKETED